jgi:hypothetical protein
MRKEYVMERIVTRPQACDMGSGFGYIKINEKTTLKELLDYYRQNARTWGTCLIKYKNGEVLRKFDFDIYNNNQFYYKLSWELDFLVQEAKFEYCFMSEDLTITLTR